MASMSAPEALIVVVFKGESSGRMDVHIDTYTYTIKRKVNIYLNTRINTQNVPRLVNDLCSVLYRQSENNRYFRKKGGGPRHTWAPRMSSSSFPCGAHNSDIHCTCMSIRTTCPVIIPTYTVILLKLEAYLYLLPFAYYPF
jgi:hypothetical protein